MANQVRISNSQTGYDIQCTGPPYSPNHQVTVTTFIAEFSDYLESLILSSEPLVITGDFNILVDSTQNLDAIHFCDMLESVNLQQHVTTSTHVHGHTLDLIITRMSESIIQGVPVSDIYFLIIFQFCAIFNSVNLAYLPNRCHLGKLSLLIGLDLR